MQVKQVVVKDMVDFTMPLFQKHYDEVPLADGSKKMELDWDSYNLLEKAGLLLCLALMNEKKEPEVVGYLVAVASPLLHHKNELCLRTDCFYVAPEYRKGKGFNMLLAAYHKKAAEADITEVRIICNENFKVSSDILATKGYQLVEKSYRLTEE